MNKTILFIDDDQFIISTYRDLFATLFPEENRLFAMNRAEILDALQNHEIDCIVSDYDIGMTSVAGVFSHALSQHPKLAKIPVVLATGQLSKGMILRSFPPEIQIMGVVDRMVPIRALGKVITIALSGQYQDCLQEVQQFKDGYPHEDELAKTRESKCLILEKR